jgi:hypothetical protein
VEVVRVAEVLERGDAGVVLVELVDNGLGGVARIAFSPDFSRKELKRAVSVA